MKVCLCIAFMAAVIAACSSPARSEWQTYTVTDGLADDYVTAILEDSRGNLWFGTNSGGASCFDGVNWTTFTAEGLDAYPVSAICEDSSKRLWFGIAYSYFGGGVRCYDGVNWVTYTAGNGLAANYITAITEDSKGNLWFGTLLHGVSRYDGASWTTYAASDGLADDYVTTITEDSNGYLWFGTRSGASRYDGASWTTYTARDGLADDYVMAITEDSNGCLWFGTRDGVSRYDGANWTTYGEAEGLAGSSVRAILEDSSGDLWFGTDTGVSRYNGTDWTTYTDADGLAGNSVGEIIEDSSGNLWFGTDAGVSRYDRTSWATLTTDDGLANNEVYAILEDSNGYLWFGTYGGGVSRYYGAKWTTFTTGNGLADGRVLAILEDHSGNLWFATANGISCYDGAQWTTYTVEDGLAHNYVPAIFEDSNGNMWFGTGDGLSRYDGITWTTFFPKDGLAYERVLAICEDSDGNLWFGTWDGVSRYDGVNWTTYREADGLADNFCGAILQDSDGNLWFGNSGGVSCYDGTNWTTYTEADGLECNYVTSACEDGNGKIWFASLGGVSCYSGGSWVTYTTSDGLADDGVRAITEDSNGRIWLGTAKGVTLHEPDRVAPQTLIWHGPPLVSPNTIQTISYCAAFGEVRGIVFSYSMDGSAWSGWSSVNSWTASSMSDGEHVFRVRARDRTGNVDSTPAVCAFEIDATAPTPMIMYPVFREAVRGMLTVVGTASDARFAQYVLEVSAAGSQLWDTLACSHAPTVEGVLGTWDTDYFVEGDYDIRLSVKDTLGLTGIDLVRVIVDNEAPWAGETTPIAVSGSTGGDVYTTNREIHLYFPPHAFDDAALVRIEPAGVLGDVPDDVEIVDTGYEISWEGKELRKTATLEVLLGDAVVNGDSDRVLALYVRVGKQEWKRLGGTVNLGQQTMSAAIDHEGTYCLCLDSGGPGTGGGLSRISIAPRVFSPRGSFANTEVAIGFSLGYAGPVSVRIYNRAGRLVDEVVGGAHMNAGANVVLWDGRDSSGDEAPDGLYMVAVQAMGQTQVKTLSVVR